MWRSLLAFVAAVAVGQYAPYEPRGVVHDPLVLQARDFEVEKHLDRAILARNAHELSPAEPSRWVGKAGTDEGGRGGGPVRV